MKTIYKYALSPDGRIVLPIDAKILSIQSQNGEPVLWALVDPSNNNVLRKLRVYGTGHTCGSLAEKFIATVQLGELVFHFFEEDLP